MCNENEELAFGLALSDPLQVIGTTSKSSRAELEELLRSAHVVSLNCPHTPATQGLIGAKGTNLKIET